MTRSTTQNPLNQIPLSQRSSTTSRRRIWIVYDKSKENLDRLQQVEGEFGWSTDKLKEDLDHLLQVAGGFGLSCHTRFWKGTECISYVRQDQVPHI
jgi:hypothetical protein